MVTATTGLPHGQWVYAQENPLLGEHDVPVVPTRATNPPPTPETTCVESHSGHTLSSSRSSRIKNRSNA